MDRNSRSPARLTAFGGIMAALAVAIMSLGGLIPIATYTSPMLCMILLQFVMISCGSRIALAWYLAVAVLSVLLSADKEAAGVFVFIGYYPLIKRKFEGEKLSILLKYAFFNLSIVCLYFFIIRILGIPEICEEFREAGKIMLAIMAVMGNLVFGLFDRLLGMEKFQRIRFVG